MHAESKLRNHKKPREVTLAAFFIGRRPASWPAQRLYKPPEGASKLAGIVTPVFRFNVPIVAWLLLSRHRGPNWMSCRRQPCPRARAPPRSSTHEEYLSSGLPVVSPDVPFLLQFPCTNYGQKNFRVKPVLLLTLLLNMAIISHVRKTQCNLGGLYWAKTTGG